MPELRTRWLDRQNSPALADMTARYLLVDARTSQAQFIIPIHLAQADRLFRSTSHREVEAIATEVGYAYGVTLRTLLRERLGRGVEELRRLKVCRLFGSDLDCARDGCATVRCTTEQIIRFLRGIAGCLLISKSDC